MWNLPLKVTGIFETCMALDLGYQNHQDAIARGSCGLLVALVA